MEERKFKTTFFEDFTIADHFWIGAIQETFERAFAERKTDYKYLTELVIALNRKMFQRYEKDNSKAQVYQDLWQKADDYAMDNLKDEELNYFLTETD